MPDGSVVNLTPGLERLEGWPTLPGKVDAAVAPSTLSRQRSGVLRTGATSKSTVGRHGWRAKMGKTLTNAVRTSGGNRSKSLSASSAKSKYSRPSASRARPATSVPGSPLRVTSLDFCVR